MAGIDAQRVAGIAARIRARAAESDRLLVAIAGPPGAGKSSLTQHLLDALNETSPECAALAPMDGYHYDNRILTARAMLHRKGAPETFNVHGLLCDLQQIRAGAHDVAVPLFDRAADFARANAALIKADQHKIVLVEGNYLLLNRPVWSDLAALFDLTVYLSVDTAELEKRLIARWLDHGLDRAAAEKRARDNDLENANTVIAGSQPADIVLDNM
ncbi:MAG: nucleoside/nucleotide kinase family protein [Hyphomicrobiales bacterium]|nr:nucleoside/nucleotide kinase family protein [Hyphomicrobiales bacterium]